MLKFSGSKSRSSKSRTNSMKRSMSREYTSGTNPVESKSKTSLRSKSSSRSRSKSRSKSRSIKRLNFIAAPKTEFGIRTIDNKLVSHKVIGVGGYGCILSPPLALNEEPDENEVTKIARDAYVEYDTAAAIYTALLDYDNESPYNVGVFPVGDLKCGLKPRDLGVNYASIIEKCSKQLNNSNIVERQADIKFNDFTGKLNGGRKSCGMRGGDTYDMLRKEFCAFNVTRYWKDLDQLSTKLRDSYEIKESMGTKLKPSYVPKYNTDGLIQFCKDMADKLHKLHNVGFVHLDIKPGNIAVQRDLANFGKPYALLADWGFSLSLDDQQDVIEVIIEILLGSMGGHKYRFNLMNFTNLIYTEERGKYLNYNVPREVPFYVELILDSVTKKCFSRQHTLQMYLRNRLADSAKYLLAEENYDNLAKFIVAYDMLCMVGGPIALILSQVKFTTEQINDLFAYIDTLMPKFK